MRTAFFALTVPVVELVVGPWALTGLEAGDDVPAWLQPVGAAVVVAALVVLADAYVRFAREGGGTPAAMFEGVRVADAAAGNISHEA